MRPLEAIKSLPRESRCRFDWRPVLSDPEWAEASHPWLRVGNPERHWGREKPAACEIIWSRPWTTRLTKLTRGLIFVSSFKTKEGFETWQLSAEEYFTDVSKYEAS